MKNDKPTFIDAGTGKPILPQKTTIDPNATATDIEPTEQENLRLRLDDLSPDSAEYKQLSSIVTPQAEDRAITENLSPQDAIKNLMNKLKPSKPIEPVELEDISSLSKKFDPSKIGFTYEPKAPTISEATKTKLPTIEDLQSVKPKYTYKMRQRILNRRKQIADRYDNELTEHQKNVFNQEYENTKQPNISITEEGSYERAEDNIQNAKQAFLKAQAAPETDPDADATQKPDVDTDTPSAPPADTNITEDFGEDALKSFGEAAEIDAETGGPTDVVGDVIAIGAGLATLLFGLGSHSNNSPPKILQSNPTMQQGTGLV